MKDALTAQSRTRNINSPGLISDDSAFSLHPSSHPMSSPATSASVALKQRRISMADASSPRLIPPSTWSFRDDTGVDSHVAETASVVERKKGKMRRISSDDVDDFYMDAPTEKKLRKKWTKDETDMLVKGCNKHGVGNWKTILHDPEFRFDNRTPVDLKDRFRTYYPDAYREHYPNAKTHLSSKVRAMNPDGTSLFEKTRSKKRRPFTAEEDEALKAGYQKHGTVWAAIVKDPVFQAQNRRSTDLRDRFRNAFPDLYQAAGYKPRTPATKKIRDGKLPIRAATDDQLALSSTNTGPIRRRRANTSQSVFRGGTKSVPQSARASADEASSEEDEKARPLISASSVPTATTTARETSVPIKMDATSSSSTAAQMDNNSNQMDTVPDFTPFSNDLDASNSWPSGLHSQQSWSGTTGSPTTSHPSSDLFSHHSPYRNMGTIGKSVWTQDFLSPSPRLDSSSSVSNSGASSVFSLEEISSPFSFPLTHLNHNVMDRYDLFPTSYMHTDFGTTSEFGMGDHHSTFSDDMLPAAGGMYSGFTHHSNTAGDLIFGARTHQPQGQFGLGFGSYTLGDNLGVQQNSINPMQLHTPSLPGIVEMEMAGMALDDRSDRDGEALNRLSPAHPSLSSALMPPPPDAAGKEESMPLATQDLSSHGIEDILDLHSTPPATPHLSRSRPTRRDTPGATSQQGLTSLQHRSFSVPPTENRAAAQMRSAQSLTVSQSSVGAAGRQAPFYATTNYNSSHSTSQHSSFMDQQQQPQQTLSAAAQTHHGFYHSSPSTSFLGSNAPLLTMNTPTGAGSDLVAFLDLHTHAHNGLTDPFTHTGHHHHHHDTLPSIHTNIFGMEDTYRQGQDALDLASASILTPSTAKPLERPPPPSAFKRYTTATPTHQRGQSAMTSSELLLAKGDNKRKRASWDGGAP